MRILIVDDEPGNNAYVARALKEHETFSFTSPLEALKFAGEGTIDLAIVDQRMAPLTGLEFVRRLKELQDDVAAIVVSAYTERDDLIEAVNTSTI